MTHLLCIYPWLALGGADKFNLDMLGQLRARGYRITVATTLPYDHSWRAQFEQVSNSIVEVGSTSAAEQPGRLLGLLTQQRPDVVLLSNSTLAYRLLPAMCAAHPKAAYLDYNHMVDPGDPRGGYAGDSLASAAHLELQLVSSHPLQDWYLERGAEPQQVRVCTTNIDAAAWDPTRYDRSALRAALGLAETDAVGLFAARFERIKRPVLAAELMRTTVQAVPGAHFLVAGTGTYAPFLRSFVKGNRLGGRIHLLGPVPNQRMGELLAVSDLLLLPSWMEGLSLAIYEAMAMGVVPVSVAAGGQAELVTPECGVLVPHGPDERRAYAQALLRLTTDHAHRQAMGQAARERVVQHFRLEQMGDRIDQLLQEAMGRRGARPRPPIAEGEVAAAIERAIEGAAEDAARAGTARQGSRLRRALWTAYWKVVEQGAWWLVPYVEQMRQQKN
jgi:glycosyltransferase involved in cell wall biosynthesis